MCPLSHSSRRFLMPPPAGLVIAMGIGAMLLWYLPRELRSQTPILPGIAQPGTKGMIQAEFIFPLEDRPTPQCHASTIVEIESGLLAAWFGGQREGAADVGIWMSRKTDHAWSRPIEIANGEQPDGQRFPCWNPVLFRSSPAGLLLFYKVGPSPRKWWGVYRTSSDQGETWSPPTKLGQSKSLGAQNPNLSGPVKNKPLALTNGDLICPASTEHDGWRVHFEISQDGGKSWSVVGPIDPTSKFNAIQPAILRHPNRVLQALCRTKENVLVQCWSQDDGNTWGTLSATNLPNPNSGIDAVTLRDGRHLLVYNHAARTPTANGRNVLNIALSNDGRRWIPVMTLEKSKGEFSYPAVVQTADDRIHVTYTYRRETIKHVVLDPSQLDEK